MTKSMPPVRKNRRRLYLLWGTPEELEAGDAEPLYISEMAARVLGVSEAGLRYLVGQRQLTPVLRIGKALLFPAHEVEALKEKRR